MIRFEPLTFWCEKPSAQTNHQIQHTTHQQKASTTTEVSHNKKNQPPNTHEHSLSDKVKDMAHSARKLFHHHEQHGPNQAQKPTSNCSSGAACGGARTETKKKTKKTEGQEGHCMPKMLDHVKNLKKKKNKEEKYSDSSSDSDNEITKTKN